MREVRLPYVSGTANPAEKKDPPAKKPPIKSPEKKAPIGDPPTKRSPKRVSLP
jgi:hypothetical protein